MSLSLVRILVVVQLTASVMVAGVAALFMLAAPRAELAPTQATTAPDEPSNGGYYDWEREYPRIGVDFDLTRDHDRFGISCCFLHDPGDSRAEKRLFSDPYGRSNQTVIELNGRRFHFGDKYPNAKYLKDPKTKQLLRQVYCRVRKYQSVWTSAIEYQSDAGKIEVTRTVQIFPGISNLLDTVLVRYAVKNTGDVDCTVALRTHLDTCIGTTDAVPFYVPPIHGQPGSLVLARAVFEGEEIPDFVLARELDDLNDQRNTHVVLALRNRGWEAPSKLVLCHREHDANGPPAPDEEPGVVIHWAEADMQPKECREFGYTYGLGYLDVEDLPADRPQIALQFVDAAAKEPFPVIAHLGRGARNQTVTLKLPAGVEFVPGETAEKKLDATGGRNAVVWRVVAALKGSHQFEADAPGVGTAKGAVWIDRSNAARRVWE